MSSALSYPSRWIHRTRRSINRIAHGLHRTRFDFVETDLARFLGLVAEIKEADLSAVTDAQLFERACALRTKARSLAPDTLAGRREVQTIPFTLTRDVFAAVREAARRTIGLDPFDVQIIAGLAMAEGCLVELPTGEGKTLAAVFPAALHALAGRGVHVLTFNDYLARRDAAWMGPIFRMVGLTVGCVQEGLNPDDARAAYACDVTYATAKQAGFDLLRDGLATDPSAPVQRPFHFALIDEADSILIDEARTPLVIAGADEQAAWNPSGVAALVERFETGRDFETDDEHRNVFLLEAGIERVETAFGCGDLYAAGNQPLLEAMHCALHARALLRRDHDYIVRDGRIEIIDEFTGRVVDKRHWPDGLQAAVEAKEGLARRSRGRILGSITLRHFFELYPRLSGMTATARSAAEELREFYGLETVIVPPSVPSRRVDHPDIVFSDRASKRRALVREIIAVQRTGRPILVGTGSVHESEELAGELRSEGVDCAVLNAKNDEQEAAIVADAGRIGTVTISTNMAGRGTDIKLGGAEERERDSVVALGGLYVIGTNRHESLRIDRQLRGRAGRQGDPGSSRFFISLQDDLFERYGLAKTFQTRLRTSSHDGVMPPSASMQRDIEHAQRVIEGQHFDIRRTLNKYSAIVERQRRILHDRRRAILECRDVADLVGDDEGVPHVNVVPELRAKGIDRFGRQTLTRIARQVALHQIDGRWSEYLAWVQDTRDCIHLVSLGGLKPLDEFRKQAVSEFGSLEARIDDAIAADLERIVTGDVPADDVLAGMKRPSSTWTYLVNDQQFGYGIGLMQTANIGAAAAAALSVGPLLVLTLIIERFRKRSVHRRRAPRP